MGHIVVVVFLDRHQKQQQHVVQKLSVHVVVHVDEADDNYGYDDDDDDADNDREDDDDDADG